MSPEDIKTLTRIDTNVQTLIARDADHETRIRGLERSKWISFAFLGAIGVKLGLPWLASFG